MARAGTINSNAKVYKIIPKKRFTFTTFIALLSLVVSIIALLKSFNVFL